MVWFVLRHIIPSCQFMPICEKMLSCDGFGTYNTLKIEFPMTTYICDIKIIVMIIIIIITVIQPRLFFSNSVMFRTSHLWNSFPLTCFPDSYPCQYFSTIFNSVRTCRITKILGALWLLIMKNYSWKKAKWKRLSNP